MPTDLNYVRLKNDPKHRHRFVMVANYSVDDKLMAKIAEAGLAAKYASDNDKDYDGGPVNIPMGQDELIGVDGPGCAKCGAHWQMPTDEQSGFGGWGTPCPVNDDVFAQAGQPVRTPQPVTFEENNAPVS